MNPIILKIRKEYDSYTKNNRQIADAITKDINAFTTLTATEIGEASGTSSASVVRFVQKLGYEGLDHFKMELVRSQVPEQKKSVIDPIISSEDTIEDMSRKVDVLINHAMQDFFYQLDYDMIEAAVEKMLAAETIFIVGIGASSLPAYDLYHKLNRINKRTVFNFDSHMTVEFLHYMKPTDVLIAFSFSGHSVEAIFPAEVAQEKGGTVIAVTKNKDSKLALNASIILGIPNNESTTRVGAISSKIISMIVADLLYLGFIKNDLEAIEHDLIETHSLTNKMKVK